MNNLNFASRHLSNQHHMKCFFYFFFAFPLVFLIFARLPRIDMTVTGHSSVKQKKTNFSQHRLPFNGTRNFRTSF